MMGSQKEDLIKHEIYALRNDLALNRQRIKMCQEDINHILDRINKHKAELYEMGYKGYV